MNYQNLLQAVNFTPKRMVFPYAWCGHLPFASWIITELKPKIFVELGVHTGNSYLTFCQTVSALKLDTKCYAVDTWQGDEHAGLYDDKVYNELSKYHDPLYGKFSKLIRKSFDQALVDFSDKSVDLLHIDGFHSYEAVKHDFESWLPKLADNAVVLFHDTSVFERDFGVWKFWEELCLNYDMVLNFQHSHGLGVLQLARNNSTNKLPWLTPNNIYKDKIIQCFEVLGENILSKHKMLDFEKTSETLEKKTQGEIARIASMEADIRAIKNTISWKITRPLRLVRRVCSRDFLRAIAPRICKKLLTIIKYFLYNNTILRSKLYLSIYPDEHMQMVSKRCQITKDTPTIDPITAKLLTNPPRIDISVVTYNSSEWIDGFIDSLENVNYPSSKICLYFVDNNSSDGTVKQLRNQSKRLVDSGVTVSIIENLSNKGFGAGHNIGINAGKSEFSLVTNIDLTFDPNAIIRIVSTACADTPEIAAWELRQKPYEHPKFYDPVTGLTSWNSHACVLIRRSAFEKVGGYDEAIFMYGEDVELSYRFRQKGYLLRYNPMAIVYHYTYTASNEIKPLQYEGSIFGNCYIRLKYGNFWNILAIPFMMIMVLLAPEAFKGSRRNLLSSFSKLIMIAPKAIMNRPSGRALHSFRAFDYVMARPGAFIESHRLEEESLPLVSIITRTYQGRELLVRQALLSVAHQTYPSIEHIVVQDGGDSMHEVTEGIAKLTGRDIKFIGLKKCGRSAIGNAGLSAAKGKWCLFLDDDDLLFCDHIETLVDAIKKDPNVVASYSLAWEIKTDLIANNSSITGYTEVISDIPTVIKQTFSQKILSDTNYLPIQSVLFERNLFETRGGFDEDLDALEDWLLWNRYAKDNSFAYVEKCTSMYRTPYNLNKALQRNNAFMDADSIVRKRIKLLYGTDSLSKPKTMLFPIGSFYSPIVDAVDIENRAEKIWNTSDATPGIEMNLQNQLALLKVLKPYLKTINYPIEAPKDPTIYFYKNDQYPVLDAEFLYSALCHFKPQNVIEVGSGFSSLITADVNRRILNHSIDFTCIEPYPRQFLIDGVEGVTRLVVQKVEDVELSFFNCLGDNDILLIDSSHVSKTGSDVNYLFLKVLPNLRPGVIVHIHDIFLPDDYPKEWVINEGRNWNEQYLLQAFMIGNTEWEVIWAANFMGTRYVEAIQDTFPNYPKLGGGGSFWIKKRNNS